MRFFQRFLCSHNFSSYDILIALATCFALLPRNDRSGVVIATTEHRNGFHTKRLFVLFAAGKAHQKQLELTRKLEIAKQQQQLHDPSLVNSNVTTILTGMKQNKGAFSDDECLEKKRSEFSLLLAQFKPPMDSKDTYQSSQVPVKKSTSNVTPPKKVPSKKVAPIEGEVKSSNSVDDLPLQVGDKSQRIHFETLVDAFTKKPLGSMGAAKLVPWVPPFIHRNIIIVVDPRKQSSEFRTALQYLESNNEQRKESAASNVIGITSDTSEEMIAYVQFSWSIIYLLVCFIHRLT